MKLLLCFLFSHDLEPIETLSRTTTKMFCHRCKKHYGMRREGESDDLFLWTEGMEESLRIRKRNLRAARDGVAA